MADHTDGPDTDDPNRVLTFQYGGGANGKVRCPCGHVGMSHGAGESAAARKPGAKDPCRLCGCLGFRAPAAAPAEDTAAPDGPGWRVGRALGSERTVYDVEGQLIGVMDTPALALRVVEAVNGCLTEDSAKVRADRDELLATREREQRRHDDLVAELRRTIAVRDRQLAGLPVQDSQDDSAAPAMHDPRRPQLGDADVDMLLLSATRYALGRATYIVGWTVDLLTAHAPWLAPGQRAVAVRDIEKALADSRTGHDQDTRQWGRALDALRATRPAGGEST